MALTGRIRVWPKAVAANFARMRRQGGNAAAVVKADAYGLGLGGVVPALLAEGCTQFFVARLEEGMALRALAPQARIFVLDGVPEGTGPALASHRLIPVLGSLDEISRWQGEAALHVDTGMNRLGLPPEGVAEAARRLKDRAPVLVMSHLACGDDPNSPMNAEQLSRFREALATLPTAPASLAASGGVFLGKDYHFDLVRPGIGLYGGHPQPGHGPNPVQCVVRLTGTILQLRRIGAGESVGYGGTFHAARPSIIATLALGYADGVLRSAGNRACAVIRGRRAPFVGRVSMDLIGLDVTDVEGVAAGDEAELFGPALPLDEAAAAWGTISYELLTGLSRRLPRVYEGTQ
ncbi:MAG: alanine racemase [Alphaproteobacteria bacterium]|nr:alanine racemase [Alphaproteobacteria bacterium]